MTHPECQAERYLHEQWHKACKQIIDHWVAPDMHPQAMAMLELAFAAAYGNRYSQVALPPVAKATYKIPFAVTWHCELADCLCHGKTANVRAKCFNFIAAAPQTPEAS